MKKQFLKMKMMNKNLKLKFTQVYNYFNKFKVKIKN